MKRELRVAGLLVSWQFLLLVALLCALLVVTRGTRNGHLEPLSALLLPLALLELTRRIVRVGEADTWRLLPAGFTTFIRAVALVVLGITLLVGGFATWSSGQHSLKAVPYAGLSLCFVFLSMLSILMFITIRQSRGGYLLAFGAIGGFLATSFLYQKFPSPLLWWSTTSILAAGWLYACFGNLPLRSRSAREARPGLVTNTITTVRGWMLRVNSPARSLLQLDGGRVGRLTAAVLVIMVWALMWQFLLLLGRRAGAPQPLWFGGMMVILMTVMAVCALAASAAVRSRPLWLRLGNGRGGVFRTVERSLLIDLAFLSLFASLITTLLAPLRGVPVDGAQALLLLVCCFASALAPMYIALFGATLHGFLLRLLAAIVVVAAILPSSGLWSSALGIGNDEIPQYPEALIGLSLAVVLRFLAAWRWRRIDWAHFRAKPRPQALRRIAGH